MLSSIPFKNFSKTLIYCFQCDNMVDFKGFIKGQAVKMIKDPKTGQEKWVPMDYDESEESD